MTERTCPQCSGPVTGRADKRYCNEQCRKRAENKRLGHPLVTVLCAYCGTPCVKPSNGRLRRFCTLLCRNLWQIDNDPYHTGPRSSRLPASHPARWYGTSSALAYGHCLECGALHTSSANSPKVYCSTPCRNRAANRRKRPYDKARKSRVKRSRRLAIFERDAWTCWLCGGHTNPDTTVPHPLAPTIDHVTPVIDGGTDDEDNLATAHFTCNTRRGRSLNRLTMQQPA